MFKVAEGDKDPRFAARGEAAGENPGNANHT
jgi:hypothetical protein